MFCVVQMHSEQGSCLVSHCWAWFRNTHTKPALIMGSTKREPQACRPQRIVAKDFADMFGPMCARVHVWGLKICNVDCGWRSSLLAGAYSCSGGGLCGMCWVGGSRDSHGVVCGYALMFVLDSSTLLPQQYTLVAVQLYWAVKQVKVPPTISTVQNR